MKNDLSKEMEKKAMATKLKKKTAQKITKQTKIEKYTKKEEKDLPNYFLCCKCRKKIYDLKDFVTSQSELYAGLDNKVSICKDCIVDLYEHYLNEYKDIYEDAEIQALRRICMHFDIYFDERIYELALMKVNSQVPLINAYIRIINLNQYKGKTFDTTLDFEREQQDVIESIDDIDEEDDEISEEDIEFFGAGLPLEDYKFLRKEFNDWITRHECQTKAQEEIFKRIVFKQLEIYKATRDRRDTKDLDASFQKYLETAKIQPKQNLGDIMSDTQTFGTLLDKWENTRPLPEIDEDLKDVDRIGLYIDVFFKGHLARMMRLKNALSNLYERFIKKFTVNKPEYDNEEDSEILFDAIFGNSDLSESTTSKDFLDEEEGDLDWEE